MIKEFSPQYSTSSCDIEARYKRAEAFEHELRVQSMVLNASIYPNWIKDTDCFWYVRMIHTNTDCSVGKQFRLVDANKKTNELAFDHQVLAQALGAQLERDISADDLPIFDISMELAPIRVRFFAFSRHWMYDESSGTCCIETEYPSNWLISPDGEKAVFIKDFNIWLKDMRNGAEKPLTHDGVCHFSYGTAPERMNLVSGIGKSAFADSSLPEAIWSPDSAKLLTAKLDERGVLPLPITEYVPDDGSVRPMFTQTKYALPGDENIAEWHFLTIDVENEVITFADYPTVQDAVLWAGVFSGNRAWWSNSGCEAYFLDMKRGQQEVSVVSFNTISGSAHVLFTEKSETYIDLNLDFECPAMLYPLPYSNELIWMSERSGWAHLYLYDLKSGKLTKTITCGDWLVREILAFDIDSRDMLIQVSGRNSEIDPYYLEVCKVNVDTGSISSLTGGNYTYLVCKPEHVRVIGAINRGDAGKSCHGVSFDSKFIVTDRSRVDVPTETLLIDSNGEVVLSVESADISGVPFDWILPEPVECLSEDGITNIYGAIFRPTSFSPEQRYPVINWGHTNPFCAFVPKAFNFFPYMTLQALAELGFIVVIIDGRGSCFRSKAFHDEAYGQCHLGSNLEDHICGIKQLSRIYPYMDIDRVGITDIGGSNGPIYGVLAYPDFYKVGAVYSVWDIRLLSQSETYQGLVEESDYEASVMGTLASQLTGKLLLMHSLIDPYFHASGALQLIDELVRCNKDFDLVLLPNGGHAWSSNNYGLRRIWDYFVLHLRDEKPPREFRLSSGIEFGLENIQAKKH